jgi:hypothetical protein
MSRTHVSMCIGEAMGAISGNFGRSRRRVKNGRTAVAPMGVNSIKLENVIMPPPGVGA